MRKRAAKREGAHDRHRLILIFSSRLLFAMTESKIQCSGLTIDLQRGLQIGRLAMLQRLIRCHSKQGNSMNIQKTILFAFLVSQVAN
jgi:hypothetical protein